jgi:hypothetical protein
MSQVDGAMSGLELSGIQPNFANFAGGYAGFL